MADEIDARPPSRAADLFAQFISNGEGAIQKLIDEEISEELFIDYKRVTKDGETARLNSLTERISLERSAGSEIPRVA
jgi:hypothetical protein